MDAMEKRRGWGEGGVKRNDGIERAEVGESGTSGEWFGEITVPALIANCNDQPDPLERLLEQVRHSLDAAVDERKDRFDGARSEMVLKRVMARVQASRRRGAWLKETLRWMTAVGATLWNSRAVRMLVP